MKCKYCYFETLSGYFMNEHLLKDHKELDYYKVKIRKY